MIRKQANVTVSAEPITKARLGSQRPKKSRKSMTFVGFTICEIVRPAPKSMPARSDDEALCISPPKHVPHHEHGQRAARHEGERRGDRARRQPRHSADAVTARAAVSNPRTEADEQPREHEFFGGGRDRDRDRVTAGGPNE